MSRLLNRIQTLAPLARLAIWSFITHGIWEFFQCLFFYGMSGFSVWKGALWMLGATLADTILSVILVVGARNLGNRKPRLPPTWLLIIAGFLAAVTIETAASLGGWWRYGPMMPQIHFWGVSLGILPLIQMASLPCLGAKIAKVSPFAR